MKMVSFFITKKEGCVTQQPFPQHLHVRDTILVWCFIENLVATATNVLYLCTGSDAFPILDDFCSKSIRCFIAKRNC